MQALRSRSLSVKLAGAIMLVLLVTLGFNLWITQRRVNSQAEKAFSERLRTMTDVALGSRISNADGGHAWEVAQRYAKTQGYEFRTPAKSPLNPQDTLNAFDERAFSAFESNPALTQYVERSQSAGRQVMLFARPVVVTKDCQGCHEWEATPASDTARPHVPALFSISAPIDELAANQRANAGILIVAALVTLLLTTGTVLLVLRRVVLQPLKSILHLANRMAANDLTERLELSSGDEIGQTGDALNHALAQMSGLIRSVAENADRVAGASEKLSALSRQITSDSEETTSQATTVTTETEQVNRNLQTVATGAEEMGVTIRDISLNATEAARVAGEAVEKAESTNATVSKLGSSTAEIGEVIKVITSVAEQTNLLALNATIEAARAGEAGKGFAVVANEVKELAKQTAKATEEIGHKIAAIQTDAHGAVDVIAAIRSIINRINDISGTIASAVEQQGASTRTISQSLTEAANNSNMIARNIHGVAQVSQGTSSRAHESLVAADQLARMSTQLRDLVEQFKVGTAVQGNGDRRT